MLTFFCFLFRRLRGRMKRDYMPVRQCFIPVWTMSVSGEGRVFHGLAVGTGPNKIFDTGALHRLLVRL